jgi:serine/threonine protein kinase
MMHSSFIEPHLNDKRGLDYSERIWRCNMGMDEYERISKLGEGAHGVVYLYRYLGASKTESEEPDTKRRKKQIQQKRSSKVIPEYVAIKRIRLGMQSDSKGLSIEAIRELKLLLELDHPNIMPLYDVFTFKESIYLVLHYMQSDLFDIVRDTTNYTLKPGDVKAYMKMLLEAINFCHKNWVLHRDISKTRPLRFLD